MFSSPTNMRERDTRSRCVMLCIIEAIGYFVCGSAMIFAALARDQMCRVILACLLSWLKRHCNYLTTYWQLLRWVRELEVFYSHAHMWHADVPNTSSTGALLSGHKHFIELLKWSKVRLISDGFSDFHIFSTYFLHATVQHWYLKNMYAALWLLFQPHGL